MTNGDLLNERFGAWQVDSHANLHQRLHVIKTMPNHLLQMVIDLVSQLRMPLKDVA